MNNYGEIIQNFRNELGLTQKEFGDRICLSHHAVSKWECGINMPTLADVETICNTFQVSPNELLHWDRPLKKTEIWEVCGNAVAQCGRYELHEVKRKLSEMGFEEITVFAPCAPCISARYNPMEYLKGEQDVQRMSRCIAGQAKGAYLLTMACIWYLKDFLHEEKFKNLKGLLMLVYKKEAHADLFRELPKDSLAYKYYQSFKMSGGNIGEAFSPLSGLWSKEWEKMVSEDDVSMDSLLRPSEKKRVLLLVRDMQESETGTLLFKILFSQLKQEYSRLIAKAA